MSAHPAPLPAIVGYQVYCSVSGEHWNDRPSFEILTAETAIQEYLASRREKRRGQFFQLIAILDGDIEKPTFEKMVP